MKAACKRCGRPVNLLVLRETEEPIELDPIAGLDGRYRLVGEDSRYAEKIDRPGHLGYQPHSETCPAQERQP